jgi:hypothetical protein
MLNKTGFVVGFFLISGLFSSTSFAQISGYMGKRFSIGYGGNIGYAMFSRNSSGSSLFATSEVDFPDKLFSFNYKHQAHMELVLSDDQVLGKRLNRATTTRVPLMSIITLLNLLVKTSMQI